MDTRFETYGQMVCHYIRHATGREKQEIQTELAAHMEDHAQALMDAGYDEAHAVSAVTYNKNPFYEPLNLWNGYWDFSWDGLHRNCSWNDGTFTLWEVSRGDQITFHYNRYGAVFDLDIPLDWEEVPE